MRYLICFRNCFHRTRLAQHRLLCHAGQQIANGGTDLTLAKLREAKKKLDLADVDPSIPRYIAVGPDQIEALLGSTTVTSADFNTVKALVTR